MKKALMIVLAVVVIVAAVIATRPGTWHVERSASIAASSDVVYGNLVDFHRWGQWSPWEELDPAMKRDFSGSSSGVGAVYRWAGNNKVGVGNMTIAAAEPGSKIRIDLQFLQPWSSRSTATFTLAPADAGTTVTWSMDGRNDFVAKAFSLFMNMDSAIGRDFERGLARLKLVAEAQAADQDSTASAKPSVANGPSGTLTN